MLCARLIRVLIRVLVMLCARLISVLPSDMNRDIKTGTVGDKESVIFCLVGLSKFLCFVHF